jgi:predicted RNase H-like HicB family nuclease
MAEFHRYPLRVQQSKLDGWWFIFIDEVPELGVVGPKYEDLLDRIKVLAGDLFRARGETVTDIKIIPSKKPALQVFHWACRKKEINKARVRDLENAPGR